ncbi:MAG TPA: hypothetical protein VLX29_03340, partial [Nitrospirota bacterium]|nr:hypothetical protein [Nitrospirota bacterium]
DHFEGSDPFRAKVKKRLWRKFPVILQALTHRYGDVPEGLVIARRHSPPPRSLLKRVFRLRHRRRRTGARKEGKKKNSYYENPFHI